eukprot:TRINITY_DN108466_c0_g1_i1.p1 TRINITY_DN108466_c0_g1~~TRINITY_DN108466_c0_g1_i1.p1  ORF type:complete len:293 (+),score=53.37 TRINITY_DN108466_c0_g1_i1:61-879(+)
MEAAEGQAGQAGRDRQPASRSTDSGKDPVWPGQSSRFAANAGGGAVGDGRAPAASSSVPSEDKFAAQVAAAAAAAVEMPTSMNSRANHRGYSSKAAQEMREMTNLIQKAQKEAERKRSGGADVQSAQLDARRRAGGMDLHERILNAQRKNIPSAQAAALERRPNAAAAYSAGWGYTEGRGLQWPIGGQEFLGNWVDMQGNSVLVYSVDAFEMRLMASVSRPAGRSLQLSLRELPDGGWICGNATLDFSMSSMEELHWVGHNGKYSVWTRGRA